MEISGGLGVDASELDEHRLAALLVPAGFQLRAVSAVLVTAGEAVTGEQGIEVQSRAADDDGLLPAREDIVDALRRVVRIAGDGVVFPRVGDADHVVRDPLHLLRRRRGGVDDHAAVDLHRVAGDDLAAEHFRKLDAEPRFAAARRADDAYEFHFLPPALKRA